MNCQPAPDEVRINDIFLLIFVSIFPILGVFLIGQLFKFCPNSKQCQTKSLIIFSVQVMEMLACNCRRMCVVGTCSCVNVGLKCTAACSLGNCENRSINDDEDNKDLKTKLQIMNQMRTVINLIHVCLLMEYYCYQYFPLYYIISSLSEVIIMC